MTQPSPLPHFVAFMVRIPHANRAQLQTVIHQYASDFDSSGNSVENAKFLLALEKDKQNREHIHGILIGPKVHVEKQYNKIQRHFRDKWNLKGQAQKGGLKEYGRIRSIRDKNKCLSYTVKDNNVYTSDSWDIDLTPYIAASGS